MVVSEEGVCISTPASRLRKRSTTPLDSFARTTHHPVQFPHVLGQRDPTRLLARVGMRGLSQLVYYSSMSCSAISRCFLVLGVLVDHIGTILGIGSTGPAFMFHPIRECVHSTRLEYISTNFSPSLLMSILPEISPQAECHRLSNCERRYSEKSVSVFASANCHPRVRSKDSDRGKTLCCTRICVTTSW